MDQALVSKMFGIVLEGGLLEDFPCRLIRRDGTVFHATYNSNCRFDKTGTMSYSRCIVQDITESLRVEQAKSPRNRRESLNTTSARRLR